VLNVTESLDWVRFLTVGDFTTAEVRWEAVHD
jgi:hypothetical protein